MNILVVNDDGINSRGIAILAKSLKRFGKVYVVAPHTEHSGIGNAITIRDAMTLHEHPDFMEGVTAWSLEGKPADCVKFALFGLNLDIDMVVSGINNGPNLGTDIFYSGTLGGASEGIICGLPSIAVSADFAGFDVAERYIDQVLDQVITADVLSDEVVISVNFPKKEFDPIKGIRITEQGIRPFSHEYEKNGNSYLPKGTWQTIDHDENTDVFAHENGYISITPIQLNRTSYSYIRTLKKLFN